MSLHQNAGSSREEMPWSLKLRKVSGRQQTSTWWQVFEVDKQPGRRKKKRKGGTEGEIEVTGRNPELILTYDGICARILLGCLDTKTHLWGV